MKHPSDWTETQRKRFLILVGLLLVAALFLVGWLVGEPMLRLASDPEAFRQWIAERQTSGLLLYGGMVCFQVFFAIIPGEPLEIAGGYAFGALWGTIACLAAATVGSLLVFLLVRRFGPRLVDVFFPKDKLHSIRCLQSSPRRTFRFLVVFMKFPVFLLICSLGRLPSLVTSTIGGDALGTQSYLFAAIVFAVTLLISGAGLLCYRWICKRHNREHPPHKPQD